jgi:hypothetical protein
MLAFINKYKKVFLLVFLALLVVVVYVFAKTKAPTEEAPPPESVVFELIKTTPPGGTQEIPLPNYSLQFTFSKEIDPSTLVIKTTPYIDLSSSVGSNGRVLAIYPTNSWKYDAFYTITFSINSKSGDTLGSEIIYEFTPKAVKGSQMDERNLR